MVSPPKLYFHLNTCQVLDRLKRKSRIDPKDRTITDLEIVKLICEARLPAAIEPRSGS